jgi:hypothetical protein
LQSNKDTLTTTLNGCPTSRQIWSTFMRQYCSQANNRLRPFRRQHFEPRERGVLAQLVRLKGELNRVIQDFAIQDA